MVTFLLSLLLVLLAVLSIMLDKAYFYLSVAELRRRAERDQLVAPALLRVACFGSPARIFLGIVTLCAVTASVSLAARALPALVGLVVIATVLLLDFFWLPPIRVSPVAVRMAVWSSPAVVWCVGALLPVLKPIAGWLKRRVNFRKHTGLYDQDDLAELFQRQAGQRDNRVSASELERLQSALQFGEVTVRQVMTSRKQVKAVNAEEAISPVLVNELHLARHPLFPVYEGEATNIVGVLAITSIADVKQHGTVRDQMDTNLAYLHESDTLEQALRAFYETRAPLFIVITAQDKYVGMVTLSDLVQRLVGGLDQQAFGHFDDRAAVRARHSKTEVVE